LFDTLITFFILRLHQFQHFCLRPLRTGTLNKVMPLCPLCEAK